jgi:hypothetical protein
LKQSGRSQQKCNECTNTGKYHNRKVMKKLPTAY